MIVVMKVKKDFTSRVVAGLDVPQETLCNIPVGQFRGKGEFTLENHKGILAYEKDLIRIAVHRGVVVIRGRDLLIVHMRQGCLRIRGIIHMIELE